jgi:hypothetical protein
MTPGQQETLDWIYQLRKDQKTSRAICVAEGWIKNLLGLGDEADDKSLETCDEILEIFDIEKAGESLTLAVLESLSNAMIDGTWESQKIKPFREKVMLYLLDRRPLPQVAIELNCTKQEILQTIKRMDI